MDIVFNPPPTQTTTPLESLGGLFKKERAAQILGNIIYPVAFCNDAYLLKTFFSSTSGFVHLFLLLSVLLLSLSKQLLIILDVLPIMHMVARKVTAFSSFFSNIYSKISAHYQNDLHSGILSTLYPRLRTAFLEFQHECSRINRVQGFIDGA